VRKVIYISGPITMRATMEEAERNFGEGVLEMQDRYPDAEIFNPCDRGIIDGWDWLDYMIDDIAKMKPCTDVYMLREWERSPGCGIEHKIAVRTDMNIIYQQ